MNKTEAFQILEIESTKDERAIKNAYRERLAVTNPEDDPEGFKELRAAYEEACRYARQKEEEEQAKPRDTSPSGLWVEKAAEIYGNIRTRRDVNLWKELFEEDIFLSLEDEENCRIKLLCFLMDHFKLPTEVWQLLDKRLSIVSDAASLREKFPADFMRYIVSKCERGEDVDFSMFEGPEDGEYDLFLQYYERCWQDLQEDRLEGAEQNLKRADALNISHPVLEVCRAQYFDKKGQQDKALELLEELLAKYPNDSMVCYNMSEMLWKRGESGDEKFRERAAGIYEKLKEESDSHYMANARLTEWYYEKGRYRDAKKCAEKVLAAGGDDSFMKLLGKVNAEIEKGLEAEYRESGQWEPALELCWCYLQDGKISAGIRLAVKIEKQLPEANQAEYCGLLAKLYVEQAEYEDSIFMTHKWEEELEKKLAAEEEGEERERDLNRRMQAHLIRIQCYHNLGFVDKENFSLAIEEGKKILTNTAEDIGVLLEMSQVYTEMEEYELGLELTRKLLDEYQIIAANASAMEIYRRQLDPGGVLRTGGQCIQYFPAYQKAYEYMAKVYLDLDYKDDLKKLCADAEKNGVKSVILDAYLYQLEHKLLGIDELNKKLKSFRKNFRTPLEEGKEEYYEKGLPILTEYVYHYPDSYMLNERGIFHRAGHHYEEAKADIEKALVLNPSNAYALNAMSFVHKYMGNYDKALFYIKKAILYMDEKMSRVIYADMGNLYALLGDYEMALASYRQYEQELGESREYWQLRVMAEFHAQLGHVESAEGLYRKAYEHNNKETAKYYENIAGLYIGIGMEDRARQTLEKWARDLKVDRRDNLWGRIKRLFSSYRTHNLTIYLKEITDSVIFFQHEGWTELVFGQPAAAVRAFDRMAQCLTGQAIAETKNQMIQNGQGVLFNDPVWQSEDESKLCDAVFAAILCGSESKGREYSRRLRDWLDRQKCSDTTPYYNRPKALAQIEFLADYYTEPEERLQEILDRAEGCEICHFCTNTICKELESMRVLLLLRQGKREEAAARIKRNLEIQPWDEFMRAIRHMAFHDEM